MAAAHYSKQSQKKQNRQKGMVTRSRYVGASPGRALTLHRAVDHHEGHPGRTSRMQTQEGVCWCVSYD